MRKPVVLGAAALVFGAGLGVLGALAVRVSSPSSEDLVESVSVLDPQQSAIFAADRPGFGTVLLYAAVGGVVTAVILGGVSLVGRRLVRAPLPAALAPVAVVVASVLIAVAGAEVSAIWTQDTDRTTTISNVGVAYSSTLTVTYDPDRTDVLVPSAIGGLVAGIVLAVGYVAVRVRSARRAARSS